MSSLLQTAEAQAGISAELLQRYVYTGDDVYISELNGHAIAAQAALNDALARGGPDRLPEVVASGSELVQGASTVTALRSSGDQAGALAELERLVPIFREYRLTLDEMSTDELADVERLRAEADQAGKIAFWLLVASGAGGVIVAIFVSYWVGRSIIKPLASLERTARKVSEGDLTARAAEDGPREFSHLGAVLNEMMSAIEERTGDLRDANRRLRTQNKELTDARMQAASDPLTGLGNHRSFHKTLRDEAAVAELNNAPLGLIVVDIDGFKGVNDSLGHLAGDQLLREVAAALSQVVDKQAVYRYGGDEFAVILPGCDQANAVAKAELLKGATLGGSGITASFGVASYPESAQTSQELVYRADMAMYWAKSAGKNRVQSWSDVSGRAGDSTSVIGDRRRPGDVISSLVVVLTAKDQSWRERAERCATYSSELATAMGLKDDDVAEVRLAAFVHDAGILATPNAILQKPGPLSAAELSVVKRHAADGANMLSHASATGVVTSAVRHHHERFDGTGYPDGLEGEAISLAARIIAVVDAYVAMTSDRPHREAKPDEAARDELRIGRGTQFDPRIVDAFLNVLARPSSTSADTVAIRSNAA